MFITKFKSLKNSDTFFYFSIVCMCVACSVLIGSICLSISTEVSCNVAKYVPTVVIDAGHGGEDGGASSPNGTLEKDINLSIARILRDLFEVTGFNVKMIRDDDISIYDQSAKTVRQKKVNDLEKRVEIINSSRNNILISIHQNKFPQSKYFGTQIFYSKESKSSMELAEKIKKSVVGLLQPDNTRETKPGEDIFILSQTKNPAVVVECGFLSNAEEERKLTTSEYQRQMAFAIYCGFMQYYKAM